MSRDRDAEREYRRKRKESDIAFMANASEEHKALWTIERHLHNKPDNRRQYMAAIDRLIEITPFDPRAGKGGKHGRIKEIIENEDY